MSSWTNSDGAVAGKLTDDGETWHEAAGGDEHAVVRAASDQLALVIEAGREPLDDPEELEDLEVIGRRFAVWATLRGKLAIEVLEEA